MQKSFLILVLVFVFSFPDGFSQNRSILFNERPWKEIVEMAKKDNKMIFLDAYASWCSPCKWMAANMFTNDTIADYYNKTFICASVDMEKGEGLTLRQKYAVRAYPSLLFINGNEEMVHERVGAPQKVRDYIEMARVAQIPEEGLAAYMRKYDAGNNSPEFILSFLNRLVEAYIPINTVLKKYFATQSESDLFNRWNWNIIYRYVIDMDDPQFGYFLKHQDEYGKLYSRDSVIEKIGSIYDYALQKCFRTSQSAKNDSSYEALKSQIKHSGFEGAGKIIFHSDLQLFQVRGKNDAYVQLLYDGLDKYYSEDYAMLTNAAYTVSSLTGDVKYLEKAGEWAKRSISMKSGPYNNDIYASILFKLGKFNEAISYEEDAITLARNLNVPTARFEEALKKMQEHK